MLDIFLIYPPVYYDKNGESHCLDVEHPPLGILYLAAVLRENGYKVGVLDAGAEKLTLQQLADKVKKANPRVVGLSSMTATLRGAVQTAEHLRKKFPKMIIGLGGPHISADPDFIRRFKKIFDFGVTGEAEITILKLMKKILEGKKIKGLFVSEPVLNLDVLPEPARDLVAHLPYGKGAMLFSSRGCPYNCIFCSRPAISRQIRFRSPKMIVNEIETIYNNGETLFMFEDDTLTLNRKHAMGLFDEIIKRNLKITWTGITRADRVDEGIIKKAKESGCVELTFGVESGSGKIRNKIIHKNLPDFIIKKAFRLCNKYNIKVNAFLMLGFPSETAKDMEKTVNFYRHHNLNIIGLHITIPLPGSEVYNDAVRSGRLSPTVIDKFACGELGEGFHGVWPYYVPDGYALKDLENYRRQAYQKFYFRPIYLIRRFFSDISSREKMMFDLRTAISLLKRGDTLRQ